MNCSDMPINWDTMTHEKYQEEIENQLGFRDKIMADYIAGKYNEIRNGTSSRKKILVIMNYRHAYKKMNCSDGNTAYYLDNMFPDKVGNVMLNFVKLMPGTTDQDPIMAPIQDGKWDAAFRYVNKTKLAFDFSNTPFGKDHFDYFDFYEHNYRYEDIFDGFIFYYPLEKHVEEGGIPGFLDDSFLTTYNKRMRIMYPDSKDLLVSDINDFNKIWKEPYPDIFSYNKEIETWLKY
jgi:hypothetical protein